MITSTTTVTCQPAACNNACHTQCTGCSLYEFCLSAAGSRGNAIDGLVSSRLQIKRGEALYRAGDDFHSLYVVHSGFFKTYAIAEDGRDQINGFHMSGEVIGMDGIETDQYTTFAVALEDSQVCVVPFAALEAACSKTPVLQRQLYRMLSHEIVRNQGLSMLLGSRRAEEKVATFMLDLSQRFAQRGYAAAEFHLRMTREEIGSYLGLTLETVSRVFSKFQDIGLFQVHNKHIQMLNVTGMAAAMNEPSPSVAQPRTVISAQARRADTHVRGTVSRARAAFAM